MKSFNNLDTFDFSFLDLPEFKKNYTFGPNGTAIRFYVEGIRCGKCVRKLEDLSLSVPGLKQMRVELGKNLAYAEVNSEILSFSHLAQKIADLGFNPIPLSDPTQEHLAQKKEERDELIRLAVAATCAGNIMTFSFATYLGETESFYSIFSWLSFTLYLPVVTYVAWPFYQGAWRSLRHKSLSIDLPMAVASFSGFIFSTVELLRGKQNIYFDSLSGFLFLILVSRWAQKRVQKKFIRAEEINETLRLQRVRVLNGTHWTWIPTDSLKIGDRILLYRSETLPADAKLEITSARFGMAWLSGEVKPKTFLQESIVPAGARLDSSIATFVVKGLLKDSNFGRIIQEVQKFSLTNNQIVSRADRWAQWLLAIVFICAFVFLFSYWSISQEEAIRRSLALIILACPCAMAFGIPLALIFSLRKVQQRGLIIRNVNVFEKIKSIQTIFFDKTGTLTDSDLTLIEELPTIPQIYQKIILSLENHSSHPIAFAFRKAIPKIETLLSVEQLRERPGIGVCGYIYGRFYELRAKATGINTNVIGESHFNNSKVSCTLLEDQQPLFTFTFEAAIKPDCQSILAELRKRNYRVILISGDRKETVESLGNKLDFKSEDIFSEMNPEQKLHLVSKTPNSMMIGDGVNDSLAMMNASVSVASSGGVEAALKSSDVYLTEPSLKGILDLLDISKDSMRLVQQNLMISIVYNLLGGTLALAGSINPFVAAVLMPISSGFILFTTWLRGRG